MSMLIQHNMMAWNAERQFNTVTKAKNKKAEKLSSGYRINRAADDAAGLAISEKMRRQIRGLKVGTENAEIGISWVQIGEGALNEAHDILHRMNELSIKAQNGTNTLTDRAYMEAEFEQLQGELDRISTTTTFNELNIFEEHEPIYDQICGNKHWDYEEYHTITSANNQLTIAYRDRAESKAQVMTITVPPGQYTTHELIDEIDTAFGVDSPIHMEYTEKGFCRLNLEDGEVMDSVSGGLTYLLWDCYDGGGYGALIGTTDFGPDPDDPNKALKVVKGQNDYMKFTFEYFDADKGDVPPIELNLFDLAMNAGYSSITTPEGPTVMLTKTQVMDLIDNAVPSATGLRTDHHGNSIMLYSPDGIVTGFKGNMFKIESTRPIYNSAFYDNIQEGYVWQDPAFVVGGAVLTTDSRDKEHNRYYIDESNNKLVLQPNLTGKEYTIEIDVKRDKDGNLIGYTASEMVEHLKQKFKDAGLENELTACLVKEKERVKFPDGSTPDGSKTATSADREFVGDDYVYFEGVEIRTVKEGPDAIVNIKKDKDGNVDKSASTAYDTLFTIKNYNVYSSGVDDATISNETRGDYNAYFQSERNYTNSPTTTTIKNGVNDRFTITLKSKNENGSYDFDNAQGKTYTIDILASGSKSMSGSTIAGEIQKQIAANAELKDRIEAKYENGRVIIRDKEDLTLNDANDKYLNWTTEISVGASGSNAGYRDIFQRKYEYEVNYTASGKGTLKITNNGKTDGQGMWITVNGNREWYKFNGKTNLADAVKEANKETPITFTEISRPGNTVLRDFTASGSGKTGIKDWDGGTAKGSSSPVEGQTGLTANEPAKLTLEPPLTVSTSTPVVVQTGVNDQITIALNGVKKTLTLADGTYTSASQVAEALQNAINDKDNGGFGEGWGGATVDVEGNSLVITSVLPPGIDGSYTSITSYGQGKETNTFFDSLNKEETAASCTSSQKLASSVTLTDGSDTFDFTYTDSTGTHNVSLNLIPADDGSTKSVSVLSVIQDRLKKDKNTDGSAINVTATTDANGYLVLTTKETGSGTSISYSANASGGNANSVVFGDLTQPTAAQTILNQKIKTSASFDGTKSFSFTLDGTTTQTVNIGKWSSAQDLVNKLNTAFGSTIPVTASLVDVIKDNKGNITEAKLCLTKNDPGGGSIHIDYANGGTVMPEIFGYQAKPGVTLSSSGSTLIITGQPGDRIEVDSLYSGGTMKKRTATAYIDPTQVAGNINSGFHSAKYSTVTSVALNKDGIKLDRWNSDLQFTFMHGTGKVGATKPTTKVDIKLKGNPDANGVTSLEDIRKELQAEIDKQLGKDAVEVLLDANNRLIFKSKKPGAEFQFSDMRSSSYTVNDQDRNKVGGGFFHHVMCKYTTTKRKLDDPTDINGDQEAGDIFAQGRHDLTFDPAGLHPGISDTLILDLNYFADADHDGVLDADKDRNGKLDDTEKKDVKTITLTLKLDGYTKPESYLYSSSDEVLKALREKIKEALNSEDAKKQAAAAGVVLHEDLIQVDIGRHDTGVVGNKDKTSISFTINKNPDIAVPEEGYFYIDGIRGNAAYETFYYTEGDLIPAFIEGTKDISDGVTLGKDDNELVFLVDGELKTIDLSKLEKGKKYSAAEIVQAITDEFDAQNLPLAVSLGRKGNLRISYKRMGLHRIEQVTGSARNELFFIEHAAKRTSNERDIRVSSFEGDRLSVYSPRFSTSLLGINSICISTVKNAEKATNRLKEAIRKVSDMRSTFGAIQNRFEHTVNNNLNKHENLQAAESRIRDADISKEMVDFSNLSIIQQAGQAVLAQANQSRNAMLALLG